MTSEDRITSLHARMRARSRARERRKTSAIGAAAAVLSVCLCLLVSGGDMDHNGGTAGTYSGSTMLFEDIGGYVLVAVISFVAAVVITVFCIRWKSRPKEEMTVDENTREESVNKHEE